MNKGLRTRHAHAAAPPRPVQCAVLTVSDTRGPDSDPGGDGLVRLLVSRGHAVPRRGWSRDSIPAIRSMVRDALKDAAIDVALVTGGTGIAPRDRTPEAVRPLLEIELPGFGERFRARSVEHIGEAAWLSRAFAGVARGRLVVVLPGSPAAVDLALREVLLPELGHALRLLGRFST